MHALDGINNIDWKLLFDLYNREQSNHSESIELIKQSVYISMELSKSSITTPVVIVKNGSYCSFWLLHYGLNNVISGTSGFYFSNFISITSTPAIELLKKHSISLIKERYTEISDLYLTGPIHNSVLFERGLKLFDSNLYLSGMPSNNAKLIKHVTEAGFTKEKDLIELVYSHSEKNSKIVNSDGRILSKLNRKLSFVNITNKNADKYISEINNCYNEAWKNNWGFSPSELKEFQIAIETLSNLHGVIALKGSSVVGFVMLRIYPDEKYARAFLSGVMPKYRKIGLAPLLTTMLARMAIKEHQINKYTISWMLEDNYIIIKTMKNYLKHGNTEERRYRVFRVN